MSSGRELETNWASGISAAYNYATERVFVSPPVDGWVFAVGGSLPEPFVEPPPRLHPQYGDIGKKFDVLLSRLMRRFDDVQFFGTHRVVGLVAWARTSKEKPVRISSFSCTGSDCYVFGNVGDQPPKEAQLRFADLTGLSPSDARDRLFKIEQEQNAEEDALVAMGLSGREAAARVLQEGRYALPGEQDVFDLAALWSIDPTKLSDQDRPLSLVLASRLPKNVSQRVETDR